MRSFLSTLIKLFVGFWLYPLLFVPLMILYAPKALDWWVHVYAEYLRLWGI